MFEQAGRQSTVTLHWVRIKRENLLPRLKSAGGAGAAGFGVRQVGDGYWIALQDLMSDKALRVVQAVQQQESGLREARFVVLDLRGNGGGSSEMGREIEKALMGEAAVTARLGSAMTDCGSMEIYRATRGNLSQLEYMQNQPFVAAGGAEVRNLVADEIGRIRAALAAGHQFSDELHCTTQPKQSETPPSPPPSLLKGKLILLTDNACFSSCLAVTDDFRTLGAFHVGQTTDAATHFVDVREQYLPSGYSLFSTLQAVSGVTDQVGPFDPALTYDGDIADTAALENWITQTVVR